MPRRLWLSVVMLAVGASLLVGASLANAASSSSNAAGSAAKIKSGGTYRYSSTSDVDSIDPGIAYGTTSWWIEYATQAKLYNYPDKPAPKGTRLQPEVASRFKVSNKGRTYTFTIRKGFRFSNGAAVTANSFRYAINRNLQKDLQSPAAQFITDPNGANIVGAAKVNAGNGSAASGVRVKGNKLIIRLTKPDPTFMAKITMPFFSATSTKLALKSEKVNVSSGSPLPTAGPYFVSSREANRAIVLKRNPYYKAGPGRKRPHRLNQVNITVGVNEEAGYRQVLANQIDEGPLPAAEVANVSRRFGVNKTRFWVKPRVCNSYLAMNTSRPLFRNNPNLRKAVNFIIRRQQMVNQRGLYSGVPWDHVLPPGMPGASSTHPYPLKSVNLAKARNLAKGKTRSGKANYFFFNNSAAATNIMELNRQDLSRIGLEIEPKGFQGFDLYTAAGKRGSIHDITQAGWCQDYPDPYDFVNILLYGGNIQADNNNNLAYWNNAKYNKKMNRAAKLLGKARLRTYGALDIDIMKNQAPWAVYATASNRYIFSNRVNSKSLVYQGIYEDWSIPALALK
jgi:ABC-type oligopeptide transport system substrate-binding subunit